MFEEIFLDAPNVGSLEKQYISDAIDSGYISTFGPYVPEFEKKFSGYLNIENVVMTQSGTAALHVALHELGIGSGDEVIVPALTFVASVNPITYVGAKPVFADVEKNTWNIDPSLIEDKITERTKAILPVHLYGNPCDMARIMYVAKKHALHVIEDATESLGAKYGGKFTGTIGDFGCFSFNGNKTITTGGGGMITSKDPGKINHLHFIVNQARDAEKGYYHPEIGFNYRMTNIEASLGLAQLSRISEFMAQKERYKNIYREELRGVSSIHFQKEYNGAESSWWFNCARFDENIDVEELQKKLKDKKIPTRKVFMPVTEFPPYRQDQRKDLANSYEIARTGICLPSSTLNSEEDIRFVCKTLKEMI